MLKPTLEIVAERLVSPKFPQRSHPYIVLTVETRGCSASAKKKEGREVSETGFVTEEVLHGLSRNLDLKGFSIKGRQEWTKGKSSLDPVRPCYDPSVQT